MKNSNYVFATCDWFCTDGSQMGFGTTSEVDNHQDHVVMRHKEERPIRISDDSG